MQHTLIRLARVGDALNVNARHIKARPRKDEVGKSHFVRANRGRSFAINPADVRELNRADSNGEIPFLKGADYWEDCSDKQKNGRRKRQPNSQPQVRDEVQSYPSKHARTIRRIRKYLHERHRTTYTSPVAETEVTRDWHLGTYWRTSRRESGYFFVCTPLRAFNGRALAGEPSGSPGPVGRYANPTMCPPTSIGIGERVNTPTGGRNAC